MGDKVEATHHPFVDREKRVGLVDKYYVARVDEDPTGKHRDCRYFVLDPLHDEFAVTALAAYADACREALPELADDLDALIERQ